MDELPALAQLMGAYFHQDWDLDSPDEWAVLEMFIAGEPALASALPDEIDSVLAAGPDEDQLKELVIDRLGGSFLADWDGGTYRGWLAEIASRARTRARA